jgi:Ca2+-binding EF-hand superfamily protein
LTTTQAETMSKWDKLTDDQKEQIKAAFDICDSDQNGFIDIDELKEVLRALGEVFLIFSY